MRFEKSGILLILLVSFFLLTGLAAVAAADTQEIIEGEVTGVQHHVSTGSSDVTVKAADGTEHTVTVPLVEGEKVKVGDNAKLTIVTDDSGKIVEITIEKLESSESSEEVIEGNVTGVKHSVSTGSSEITVVDDEENEHVVNVPLIEGEDIKTGDHVKITIVRDADGNIIDIKVEKVAKAAENSEEVIEGNVTGTRHSVSTGSSEITVVDDEGNEHVVNVPLVEGEDVQPGDRVRVTIVTDAEGNIIEIRVEKLEEDSGNTEEVIEGKVTGIRHSVSTGSSEITIKDSEGNEHVVNIALVDGEKLKEGDTVKITIVRDSEGDIVEIRVEVIKEGSSSEDGSAPEDGDSEDDDGIPDGAEEEALLEETLPEEEPSNEAPAEESAESESESETEEDSESAPGFGTIIAVSAVLISAVCRRRV